MPILEPEVSIKSPDKAGAEALLRDELIRHWARCVATRRQGDVEADASGDAGFLCGTDQGIKPSPGSWPCREDTHGPRRAKRLAANHGMIASFSRALTEDLRHSMSDAEFDAALASSIDRDLPRLGREGVRRERDFGLQGRTMADQTVIEIARSPTDDVRRLIAELEDVLSAEYPPEQRHGLSLDAVFQPHILFFVARLNGAAAGCGGVALFSDFAEVKRMYVRPSARGRGVAQALLRRLENETRSAGMSLLQLETGIKQAAAIRLYERAGFSRCGAFGVYATMPQGAVATSVFFEKRLASHLGELTGAGISGTSAGGMG